MSFGIPSKGRRFSWASEVQEPLKLKRTRRFFKGLGFGFHLTREETPLQSTALLLIFPRRCQTRLGSSSQARSPPCLPKGSGFVTSFDDPFLFLFLVSVFWKDRLSDIQTLRGLR